MWTLYASSGLIMLIAALRFRKSSPKYFTRFMAISSFMFLLALLGILGML